MRLLHRIVAGSAFAAAAAFSPPAAAAPVVYQLAGTLTQVDDPRGLLPAQVAPGAVFTGSLAFDADPTCLVVAPGVCQYAAPSATLTLLVDGSPLAAISSFPLVFVQDGPMVDGFSASVAAPAPLGTDLPPTWHWGDVQLQDPGATALASGALPEALPDPALFAVRTLGAGGCYGPCGGDPLDRFRIEGTLSPAQAVPEPGAAALAGAGLAGLALCARRAGRGGRG